MNIQSVSLDISKRPAIVQTLYLGQGDKNGTTLNASIYENGLAFSLTGKSAKFAMRSPKGAGYYEVDGTVSGNVATFAIDETYAATVAGTTDCAYVEILEGDTIIASTNRFRVVVLESATENTDPNGAYTNGVQRFLDDAQDTLDDAVADSDAAAARAIAAAEAAEGVIIDAIPTMTANIKGGAKLGNGLRVDNGALHSKIVFGYEEVGDVSMPTVTIDY